MATPAHKPLRSKGLLIGKALLLICAIGIPLFALFKNLPAVLAAASSAHPGSLALVAFGLLLYTVLNASIWADVLRALGWQGSRSQATHIWIQSEALKWLPGGIWGYASRIVKAPEIGIPKALAGASLVGELLLTIGAWMIIAGIGFLLDPSLLNELQQKLSTTSEENSTPWLTWTVLSMAVVGGGILFAAPPIRRIILRKLAPLQMQKWHLSPLIRALGSYLALCAAHAALLMLLVQAVQPGSYHWGSAAATDGSAWLIGFFAIGVPGGIGVREAGITFFLSTHMSIPEAMAVAVLWRVLQIAAELTALSLSHLLCKLKANTIRNNSTYIK